MVYFFVIGSSDRRDSNYLDSFVTKELMYWLGLGLA
jgi:hypothetical protein